MAGAICKYEPILLWLSLRLICTFVVWYMAVIIYKLLVKIFFPGQVTHYKLLTYIV